MKPTSTDTQQVERDIEQAQPGASAEQAADLAALQAAAAPAPGAPGAPGEQPAEQQGPGEPSAQAMQVAALAVGILRPVIAYAVPSLRAAPSELWEPIPAGVAGILDHYGVGMEVLANPWARLALACAPLAAFAAVEAMKEPPPKPEPGQGASDVLELAGKPTEAPAPAGQNTVTFGAGPA